MRRRGLLTALGKLEARYRPAKPLPPKRVVIALYPECDPGPIMGAGGLHRSIERRFDEDEAAFFNRAFVELQTRIIHATYDEGNAHV